MSHRPAFWLALALVATVALSCGSLPAPTPAVQTVEVTRLVPVTITPLPTLPPTLPPPLIAAGDFESGAGEWYTGTFDESTISASDGQLVIHVQAPNWIATSGHPDLDYLDAPFDLTLSVTALESPPDSYAAVDFRWYDEDNFAEFGVGANGQVALGIQFDGQWTQIISWSRQPAMTRGTNVVRLVDEGIRLTAYANGTLLFDIPFVDLAPGGVSIGVVTYDEGNARWAFDDIVVREVGR